MFFYTHLADDRVAGVTEDDSSSAARRLAFRLDLPIEARFTVVSGVPSPDTIKLPPSMWEALVEIVATEFKSDAAYMAVMKGPVDLSKWHERHISAIHAIEVSLNDLFGLGEIGEGITRETYEVIARNPVYEVTCIDDY